LEEANADGAQLVKIQADLVATVEISLLDAQSTDDLTHCQKMIESNALLDSCSFAKSTSTIESQV
jgi:hypothetical protein